MSKVTQPGRGFPCSQQECGADPSRCPVLLVMNGSSQNHSTGPDSSVSDRGKETADERRQKSILCIFTDCKYLFVCELIFPFPRVTGEGAPGVETKPSPGSMLHLQVATVPSGHLLVTGQQVVKERGSY